MRCDAYTNLAEERGPFIAHGNNISLYKAFILEAFVENC